jgi:hypothetical protein
MKRLAAIVSTCAVLAAALVPSALATSVTAITEKVAAQDFAAGALVHRTKKQGLPFKRADVKARCKRQTGYWACTVHAKRSDTTTVCDGTMRIYGVPGKFKARRVLVACPA